MTNPSDIESIVRDFCSHTACKGRGTYTIKASCTNCDWKGSMELTKGHEFSRGRACPNCGCTYTLMRRPS